MMMMNITPHVAPAYTPAVAPKSGHIFRPVVQSPVGGLQPVDIVDEDLTHFLYPSVPLSQAPLTTSFDSDCNTVILTGEDAYKAMVATKIQSQINAKGGLNTHNNHTLVIEESNEAVNYSKNAKLLDLTPVLDEPVAFIASSQTFIPAPEKAQAAFRQAEILKQQDDHLRTARLQNSLIEGFTPDSPVSAKAVVSLSEAKAMVVEEVKTLPPVNVLLHKLEADYWKSLLLSANTAPKAAGGFLLPPASPSQTISFSVEAF